MWPRALTPPLLSQGALEALQGRRHGKVSRQARFHRQPKQLLTQGLLILSGQAAGERHAEQHVTCSLRLSGIKPKALLIDPHLPAKAIAPKPELASSLPPRKVDRKCGPEATQI